MEFVADLRLEPRLVTLSTNPLNRNSAAVQLLTLSELLLIFQGLVIT